MRASTVAVLAAFSAMMSAAPAKAAPPAQGDLIAACMQRAAATLHFSGTASARRGGLVVERSFGASDAAGQVPNASSTRFNIGSVTKLFTAIAVGRLADRGVLRFDAPIGSYLPHLKAAFTKITIAQLLDHTAGLGDYLRPENLAAIDKARTATDLLPLALAAPPAFPPGAKRAYSNSGFVVLGAVIEKLSGESWAAFVQKEILDPAGMANTRFDSHGGATPITRLSPSFRPDTPRPAPGPFLASPAGGMFSTPSDLSRLLTALFNGRLLSGKTLTVLLTPRPDPAGGPGLFGYGFAIREKPVLRIGIGGGAPGVNADVASFPGSGWQLVALSNADPPAATLINRVLEQALFSGDVSAACTAALSDTRLLVPPNLLMAPVRPQR